MENSKTYHLYLVIYTLEKETRKMIEQENPFKYPDQLEDFGDIVYNQFCDLEKNVAYFKNRFIILNFNVGLYLGQKHYKK
jgi:hypothetical protein